MRRASWAWLRERVAYPMFLRFTADDMLAVGRTRVSGRRHVPRSGGAIIAFNHPSYLDAPLLVAAMPRPLYFVAKQEVLGPRPLAWWFEHVAGFIPIQPSGQNEAVIERAIRVIDQGRALAVAPEGVRTHDGRLRRGMTGVAILAFATGAPIVPVGISGTYEAWPRWRRLPRPFVTTRVVAGEPIAVERDEAAIEDPRRCRQLTDLVMTRIAALAGQPYDFPGVELPR